MGTIDKPENFEELRNLHVDHSAVEYELIDLSTGEIKPWPKVTPSQCVNTAITSTDGESERSSSAPLATSSKANRAVGSPTV
jgi:hypothetical protein